MLEQDKSRCPARSGTALILTFRVQSCEPTLCLSPPRNTCALYSHSIVMHQIGVNGCGGRVLQGRGEDLSRWQRHGSRLLGYRERCCRGTEERPGESLWPSSWLVFSQHVQVEALGFQESVRWVQCARCCRWFKKLLPVATCVFHVGNRFFLPLRRSWPLVCFGAYRTHAPRFLEIGREMRDIHICPCERSYGTGCLPNPAAAGYALVYTDCFFALPS